MEPALWREFRFALTRDCANGRVTVSRPQPRACARGYKHVAPDGASVSSCAGQRRDAGREAGHARSDPRLIKTIPFLLCRGGGAFGEDGVDDFLCERGFFFQRLLSGFLALADEFAFELEPCAFFVHDSVLDTRVQDAAFLVDAVVVDDIEFGFGERR